MAVINKLAIHQFRNLNNQLIEPGVGVNLFIADNAQGKTNLIEAIYYLGHNRSFKSKHLKELIHLNADIFQLSAKVDENKIKLKKSKKQTQISINQQYIKNTSKLTKILPIQIITPDKGFIINGTPKNKRSYLDWGVFHVKPEVLKYFKDYNKALKNINVLLSKSQSQSLDFWFLELAKHAVNINRSRINYLQQLKKNSHQTLVFLSEWFKTLETFDYQFNSGWSKDIDILDSNSIYQYLLKNQSLLFNTHYLNQGSHKANIKFSLDQKAEFFFSRGEQKTLSIVFWLSQVELLVRLGIKPIVLIDDLSSELDPKKIKTILTYLNTLNVQTFITNINHNLTLSKDEKITTFSIQHGVISLIKNQDGIAI